MQQIKKTSWKWMRNVGWMSYAFLGGMQVHADQETLNKFLTAVNNQQDVVAINLLANESDSAQRTNYVEAVLRASDPQSIAHFARTAARNQVTFLSNYGLEMLVNLVGRNPVLPEAKLYLAEYFFRDKKDDKMRYLGYLIAQHWYFERNPEQRDVLLNGNLTAVQLTVDLRKALNEANVTDGDLSSIQAVRFIEASNEAVRERILADQPARLEGQPASAGRNRLSYGANRTFPTIQIERRSNGAGGPVVDGVVSASVGIHVRVFSENEELPSEGELLRL